MASHRPRKHVPRAEKRAPNHGKSPTIQAASTALAHAYRQAIGLRPGLPRFDHQWRELANEVIPRLIPACKRALADQSMAVEGADDLAQTSLAAVYLTAASWRATPEAQRPDLPADDVALIAYLAEVAKRLLRSESGIPRRPSGADPVWRRAHGVDVHEDHEVVEATAMSWSDGTPTERDLAIRDAYEQACTTLPTQRWRTVAALELAGTRTLDDLAKEAGYAAPCGALKARRAVHEHMRKALEPLLPKSRGAAKPHIAMRQPLGRPRVTPAALGHLRPSLPEVLVPPRPGECTRTPRADVKPSAPVSSLHPPETPSASKGRSMSSSRE